MPTRIKLNIFSPLPPLRTEIANHTNSLLPWLGQRADVTVWTSQEEWSRIGVDGVEVCRYHIHDMPWSRINDADVSFFNVGNNAQFHKDIFLVANSVPGVAILHDLVLQHFFAGLAIGCNWKQEYLGAMRRHHGPEAARYADMWLSGQIGHHELPSHYDLSLVAAERSIALVCHNADGAAKLQARTRLPVYHIELAMDIGTIQERPNRVIATPYRIVVFGHLGPNRRLSCLLQALADLPERDLFRLDIYGEVEDREGLWRTITELGLDVLAQLHGFVKELQLDRALSEAHLAINLRYPTMGEASASQLRIWAHALPSIVTRAGWYATLPTEAVFFVDPDNEVAGIKRHLLQFLAAPAAYEAAGRHGRRIVAIHHSPQGYVEALLEIARHAPVLHGYRTAIDLARVSSRALSCMADIDAVRQAAPGVAERIVQLLPKPPRRAPARCRR